ncbi:UNVERIFIED_CONTAM: tape measure protein [Ralstonia mannitolilytica]
MPDKLAVIQTQESIKELKQIETAGKDVNKMFKEMVTNTNKINQAFNSGRIREYSAAIRELNQYTSQYTAMERQLADALARTARLEQQQARLQTEQARTRRELAAAEREESRARQQSRREAEAEERQNRSGSTAYRQLIRDRNEARNKARDYGAQMILLNKKLRDGTITEQEYRRQLSELSRNFRTASQEAVRLDREVRRLNSSTTAGNKTGALQGRVTDIMKALGITSLIDNIASSFYKLGKSYYDTSLKLETLRLSQKSIFKTNEEVGRQNVFLTDIAQKYGIELISLSQAYNQFSASAQGTTLEGEKTQVIFDAVAKSSAMLGVSTDDTNGILRALGQMMSKGKVQAEELRGQLGDRMAGAFRLFADGMGVSTAQLDAMLKKGEVLAEDVLPKFAAQLNKKYNLGIGEEVETSQASLTRLTNAWTIFVDNVEQRSSVVGKSISSITNLITGLLREMTPSSFVTNIQKEQLEFNKLGIILRQNFDDVKRRKEIIDQMIAINPFWLDGLDKEKVTLEQISERLKATNQQYVQKIILQKYEDEINEVLEEQAERLGIIAEAYGKYSVGINNLTTEQQKIIQAYTDGSISLDQATEQMKKVNGNWEKAVQILFVMSKAVDENTITSKGFIGTMKSLNKEGQELTDKYNLQIKTIQKLTGTNGNLLGINTYLIGSNYSLGNSYDFLRQKQDLAARQQNQDYQKAIKAAREMKQAYAAFNGFFFDAKTAKNTGKKVGEWDIVDNKLVKRMPATLPEKEKKPKAATLTPEQKDALMKAQGQRDYELASNEKNRLDLKIGYEEYLQEKQNIAIRYDAKLKQFLKGANAKEIQIQGAAYKKAIDAAVQSNKELYDERTKNLKASYEKQQNIIDRDSKRLDQDQTINDVDRINKQIELDGKLIQEITKYYDKQVDLAAKSGQRVIELENARDEEIGKIEDRRIERMNSLPEAVFNEIDRQSAITQSKVESNFEDQRSLILKDKSLSVDQRAYKLSQLEKDLQIKKNEEEIKRLQLLQAQILAQQVIRSMKGQAVIITPEEERALKEYESTIKNLQNTNIGLGMDKNSEVAPEWLKTKDILVKGFQDMGLGNFAAAIGDQFDDLYKKIIEGSLTAKDAVILAASGIADGLSSMVNSQKEKTIAALDEQLKYSQEATEQELGFINSRLEALNSLEELTAEQTAERNKLEDEARVYQDQQRQREKLIETQKARAEQKAAAQQALINGALAATMTLAQMGFIAGAIPAALALGFGIAQSVAIMSKDPVPKYWKGRTGGKAEFAITQDRGREIIAGEDGRIKSLGSDSGDKMTWLDKGDTVYTADETKRILKTMGPSAKIGNKVFQRIARESMIAPQISIVNNYRDNSDELSRKIGEYLDRKLEKYSHPTTERVFGQILRHRGANNAELVGEYDLKTLEEKYYR